MSCPPAQIAAQLLGSNYLNLASIVVFYYDYFLTLPSEIAAFWRRELTLVSVLFFLNRYVQLFGNILVATQAFLPWSPQRCHQLFIYQTCVQFFGQLVIDVVLFVRTYAMYARNRCALAVLAATFLASAILFVWASIAGSAGVRYVKGNAGLPASLAAGCHSMVPEELTDRGYRFMALPIGLLVYDSVVFAFTVHRTVTLRKRGQRRLFHLLLRDGFLYYFVVTMAALINIIPFMTSTRFLIGSGAILTSTMSTTMISRLMLHLRDPDLLDSAPNCASDSTYGPIVTTIIDFGLPVSMPKHPADRSAGTAVSDGSPRLESEEFWASDSTEGIVG